MGKAVAIVLLLVCGGIVVLCVGLFALHIRDNVRAARWQRVKNCALWEMHCYLSQNSAVDGTPIVEVEIRKVARRGRRCEVLKIRSVTRVVAPDPFAPELIEAQALAWSRADTLNQLQGIL